MEKFEKKEAAFQNLIGYDDSLADAVKKAKAATECVRTREFKLATE